ncbi:hypothetical protein A0J61_04583 [Choanephora cucurbitarum]|uniref:Uncharacterized protein n=1 Tax=Choanephora cucurbitarum TaxID=101091 RepID=A0A1C7NE46_9FUNG|nr:hypothetical protein A0J61_04583 [Choanephora cucurbitarum]
MLRIILFKKKVNTAILSQCKANYKMFVLWPLMNLATGNLNFIVGEYISKTSKEEYKVDACIINTIKKELCLLETSDYFLAGDISKYGYGYVQNAFGALKMLNIAYKKYYKAPLDIAQYSVSPMRRRTKRIKCYLQAKYQTSQVQI